MPPLCARLRQKAATIATTGLQGHSHKTERARHDAFVSYAPGQRFSVLVSLPVPSLVWTDNRQHKNQGTEASRLRRSAAGSHPGDPKKKRRRFWSKYSYLYPGPSLVTWCYAQGGVRRGVVNA